MSRANATSGARDRYITIQSLTESIGASRLPVETWATLIQVHANKADVDVSRFVAERNVADQRSSPYETRWTIPYVASMDPELVDVRKSRRLVVNGRVHDIVAGKEIGRKEAIELHTVAGGLLS